MKRALILILIPLLLVSCKLDLSGDKGTATPTILPGDLEACNGPCPTIDPNDTDGPCGDQPCPTIDPNDTDGPCGDQPCPTIDPNDTDGPCGDQPCPPEEPDATP